MNPPRESDSSTLLIISPKAKMIASVVGSSTDPTTRPGEIELPTRSRVSCEPAAIGRRGFRLMFGRPAAANRLRSSPHARAAHTFA